MNSPLSRLKGGGGPGEAQIRKSGVASCLFRRFPYSSLILTEKESLGRSFTLSFKILSISKFELMESFRRSVKNNDSTSGNFVRKFYIFRKYPSPPEKSVSQPLWNKVALSYVARLLLFELMYIIFFNYKF